MIQIEIDNREPSIIKEYFNSIDNKKVITKLKNLDQGDFIIKDSNENILLIIERKTISDLLSSVKDSRYIEQSERYLELDIPSSKIYYLIEGDYEKFDKTSIEFKTIYSCIFSLSYKKEFSLLFTNNTFNTIVIIEQFLIRLLENKLSSNYKVNLVKKNSITPENINTYMLNLVPGIGFKTAESILDNYNNSVEKLINELKIDENCLDNLKVNSKKISKKIILNIKNYLINN
jgi:ERCC4-type nuclease